MAELSTMVHNFKRVSAFSPVLVCSEHFTDVRLKTAKIFSKASTQTSRVDIMTRRGNDGQVGNLIEYTCNGIYSLRREDWVGIVLPISSPAGLPKTGERMYRQRT